MRKGKKAFSCMLCVMTGVFLGQNLQMVYAQDVAQMQSLFEGAGARVSNQEGEGLESENREDFQLYLGESLVAYEEEGTRAIKTKKENTSWEYDISFAQEGVVILPTPEKIISTEEEKITYERTTIPAIKLEGKGRVEICCGVILEGVATKAGVRSCLENLVYPVKIESDRDGYSIRAEDGGEVCFTNGNFNETVEFCGEVKAENVKFFQEEKVYYELEEENSVIETSTIAKVELEKNTFTYNGHVQKPKVTVRDEKNQIISKKYYKVTYSKGCKNAGTYKVTVTGKGKYEGTRTVNFTIKKNAQEMKLNLTSKTISADKLKKSALSFMLKTSKAVGAITYKSSKGKVVKVNKNGKVTIAKNAAKGSYTITVTSKGNRNTLGKTLRVRIIIK